MPSHNELPPPVPPSERPDLGLRPEQEKYLAAKFFDLAQEVYHRIDDKILDSVADDDGKKLLEAAKIEEFIFRKAVQILGISELGRYRAMHGRSLEEADNDRDELLNDSREP
jgi:hypothetical protein